MTGQLAEKIILGIDPGTNVMGYGVIKVEDKKASIITMVPGSIPSIIFSTGCTAIC